MKTISAIKVYIWIGIACLIVLLISSASSHGQGPVVLTNNQDRYPLGLSVDYLEDPDKVWSIEEVASTAFADRFTPSQQRTLNFGLTTSAFWIRFVLVNQSRANTQWQLEIDRSTIDYVTLYLPQSSGADFSIKQAGTQLPFYDREVIHHRFIFNLFLPPQQPQTIYMRVEDSPLILPLTIWREEVLTQKNQTVMLLLGLFWGTLLIMTGYNLFLFFTLRDVSYLFYALFVFCFLMLDVIIEGLAQQHIWPNHIWWNNYSLLLFSSLTFLFLMGFTDNFLQCRLHTPKLHKAMVGLQVVFTIFLVIFFALDDPFPNITRMWLMAILATILIVIAAGYIVWRQRYRPARYFLLAWLVFLCGTFIYVLANMGLLPANSFTLNSPDVGSVILILLLSLGLADQIKLFEEEKTAALERVNEINKNLQQRSKELTTLYETSLEINSQLEISTLLQAIVRRAANLLHAEMGSFCVVQPERQTLRVVTVHNQPSKHIGRIIQFGEGVVGQVAQTGQSLMIADYQQWADKISAYTEDSIGRILGVPLNQDGHVVGVLNVFDKETGKFNPDEIQLLNLFANYAAIALEKARLFEAERQQIERLEALRQVSLDINQLQDLNVLLHKIIRQTLQLLNRKEADLFLYRPERNVLELVIDTASGDMLPIDFTLVKGEGVSGQVWATSQPVIVNDYQNWPNKSSRVIQDRIAAMGAPIQQGNNFLGVLLVTDIPENPFTAADADLASQFAIQAALAIQNTRLFEAEIHQRILAETLGEVARVINSSLNLKEVLDRVLIELEKVIPYDAVTIDLVEDHYLRLVAARNYIGQAELMNKLYPLSQFPISAKAMDLRQTLLLPDTANEPLFKPAFAGSKPVRCLIVSPLIRPGKVTGILNVISYTPDSYSQRDADIVYQFAQYVAIAIDNARLYDQIQRHNAELERSNQELQSFAYVSSHDLQEPLRKIQAFGNRLQSKHSSQLDKRGLDYLNRMQNAAARMQSLIHDLLAFAQVSSREQTFVPVNLNTTLAEVISDLEIQIEMVKGTITLNQLPIIEADPTQMHQLFQNLLSNALKFHRTGIPPEVTFSCNQEGNIVTITVEDNGIGFNEKYLDRIFNVFQRLHSRQEYEGTGVGLAVCRKIVERHHGSLTATSQPNCGTIFIISLPVQQS